MDTQNKKTVAIMTDSNSGIVTAQMPEVFVLPMPVIIENRVFFENMDITPEEFYRKQQAGVRTSTSQPSPAALMGMWDQLLESHDELTRLQRQFDASMKDIDRLEASKTSTADAVSIAVSRC